VVTPSVTGASSAKYRRRVKDAEIFLLITTVVMPPALGIAAAILRKPWWWAAALGVVIAMIAVIAPEPEAGESRLTSGDLPFLLVVALWVTGLVWLANYLAIRLWVRRRPPEAAARH
jgi:predicted cobalt transporter CbtA